MLILTAFWIFILQRYVNQSLVYIVPSNCIRKSYVMTHQFDGDKLIHDPPLSEFMLTVEYPKLATMYLHLSQPGNKIRY